VTVIDQPPLEEAILQHSMSLFEKNEALFIEVYGSEENFLAHVGVKGMKWGVRKEEEPGAGRSGGGGRGGLSPRNQKLVTAAAVAGTVAVGALLLSRGNINVWNSTSTKIAMGGARASGSILGKTGSVIVKTGAKTTTGLAKGGFKTGKVLGRVGGKAAIGAGRSAAQGVANNGRTIFDNVLKPSAKMTTKLSSGAMFKLTGRGTPFVREVVKRPLSLNPIDILLNTRGDFKRRK
jgi:hypothetical protein